MNCLLLIRVAKVVCTMDLSPHTDLSRFCGSVNVLDWLKLPLGHDIFEKEGAFIHQDVDKLLGSAVLNMSPWTAMSACIKSDDEDAGFTFK